MSAKPGGGPDERVYRFANPISRRPASIFPGEQEIPASKIFRAAFPGPARYRLRIVQSAELTGTMLPSR